MCAMFLFNHAVTLFGPNDAETTLISEFDKRGHLEHVCLANAERDSREQIRRLDLGDQNLTKHLQFGNVNCPLRLRGWLLNQALCKPIIKYSGQTQLVRAVVQDVFYAISGRPVHSNKKEFAPASKQPAKESIGS